MFFSSIEICIQLTFVTCYSSCQHLDELFEPLRLHLAPALSDAVFLGIVGGASKRLEAAIKRVSQLVVLFSH
jgi:hypothetical protein